MRCDDGEAEGGVRKALFGNRGGVDLRPGFRAEKQHVCETGSCTRPGGLSFAKFENERMRDMFFHEHSEFQFTLRSG